MSSLERYCYCCTILMHIMMGIAAYHFDVDNIILYENPDIYSQLRENYFGYSVGLWNPRDTSSKKSRILIGAPRANSSLYYGTVETGTIFQCEIGELCEEWVVAESGTSSSPNDGSWLGSSIDIKRDENAEAVICAPRWLEISDFDQHMQGICYRSKIGDLSNSVSNSEIICPLCDIVSVIENGPAFSMGQSGFSTHIIPNSEDLTIVLGCPGVNFGHGTPILWELIIPDPLQEDPEDAYTYSGYAVTSGRYYGTSERIYVTGAPRGADLYGKVVLYEFPEETNQAISLLNNKTGEQMGEYFGSVVTSCDIDGDGRDDLIVGAPQWSKESDEGRIYIFRGDVAQTSTDFKDRQHIDGEKLNGRFGSVITCLGDIDYDGYADIAVGAPYDGNGTVYIYHGGKNGLTRTQTIFAPKDTKGFGISISVPVDMDNNGYDDIAVGAYLSGHVTLYRSKRVINMTVSLSDYLSGEPLGRDAKSFLISICSFYKGKFAPNNLNVTKEITIDKMHQRANININGTLRRTHKFNDTLSLDGSCANYTISIKETNNYFLEPLTLSVTQRLTTNNEHGMLFIKQSGKTGDQHFCSSCAVTNELYQQVRSELDVRFAVEYGDDKICISNLSIHMTTNLNNISRYVIGSMPDVILDITVNNTGDPAYLAKVVITIPSFIRISYTLATCSPPTTSADNIQIICEIGNPLNTNETNHVRLGLDMKSVPHKITEIVLQANTTTQSNVTASGHHEGSLRINCVTETDIGIAGKTDIDWYSYTLKDKEKRSLSILFQHIYQIKIYGEPVIDEALLSISIPTHWKHADKEIEVVKLNKATGDLGGKEFSCVDAEKNMDSNSVNYDASTTIEWLISNNSSSRLVPQAEKKFTILDGKIFGMSPDNRTLHINCSNPSLKCKTIDCKSGPLHSIQPAARLILTFDLLLPNFTPEIIQENDIIFFVTNGSTRIQKLSDTTQTVNNMPDSILVGTMFIGAPPEHHIPIWIIGVSVCVGLLLLTFIVLALLKFGFFKRTRKLQLEAIMKEERIICGSVILETTSSGEALNNF